MGYRVMVGSKSWLCRELSGDPGRTTVKESGTIYKTETAAKAAITRAKKTHGSQPREYMIQPE